MWKRLRSALSRIDLEQRVYPVALAAFLPFAPIAGRIWRQVFGG